MKRFSVPDDNYKKFHFWLIEQSKMYGMWEDNEVRRGIEITLEAIQQQLGKVKRNKSKRHQEVRKFYAIYCQKFLTYFDIETVEELGGKEIKIIQALLDKLYKHEITCEEYLDWLFDEFYPDNPRLSAGIGLSVSKSTLNRYMIANSKRLKERDESKKKKQLSDQITKKVRTLLRKHNSEELKKLLHDFYNGDINITTLNLRLAAFENRMKNSE